jgi:hypothetical protein
MSRPRAIGVLLLLGSLGAAPVFGWRAYVEEGAGPVLTAPKPVATAGPVPGAHVVPSNCRRGVGVELQVMDLHLELAWFESVPVSPGRRLVLSWLARAPRGE